MISLRSLVIVLLVVVSVAVAIDLPNKPSTYFPLSKLDPRNRPGDDPADSWLAYAQNSGHGKLVTYVSAKWTVPYFPQLLTGSGAPGFWFGIEPVPAANLIQPILAWADGKPQYTIFNGYYQWHQFPRWTQSQSQIVQPNQTIFASVTYNNATKPPSYDMLIKCLDTGANVTTNIKVDTANNSPYTDVYFVLEKQPQHCNSYPANGNVTFYDITIEMDYTRINNSFFSHLYKPACQSNVKVLSPTSIMFVWNTSANVNEVPN